MSTLYTNLSYVNSTPDQMRNDLNMSSDIKIKLLKAGMFGTYSLDSLEDITTSSGYNITDVEIDIDRVIHIVSNSKEHNMMKEMNDVAYIWNTYVMNKLPLYKDILSPVEQLFVSSRLSTYINIPMFATLEVYGPGEYVIRI